MTTWHTLTRALLPSSLALLATAVSGCNQSHSSDDGGGPPSASDGGSGGVCCPTVDRIMPCSGGPEPVPGGGWAPSLAECTYTVRTDEQVYRRSVDPQGCPIWEDTFNCCGCIDAGMPPPPPPPTECAGLGEIECLAAGCAPMYHDACCSSCDPGAGCADCIDWEFWECRALPDACATWCSIPSPWACDGGVPDCGEAHPVNQASCNIPGCVPAMAADGFMEPVAPCVAVTANSCTVACRAFPPGCPDGFVAEGDGSCWTGRCIPRRVCEG